jgi:hypothetical protein
MRIMFELKGEELGGKGCIVWSFIVYSACQKVGYQKNIGIMGKEFRMHGSESDLNRFLIGQQEGKNPFRRPV